MTLAASGRRAAALGLSLGLLLSGCEQAPPGPPELPPLEVAVSRPVRGTIQERLEYTGTTTAVEVVEVRPRVTGFLEGIHYELRARVNAGDLLFTIDDRPFRNALDNAVARRDTLRAQLDLAQFQLEKVQELMQQRSASEQELVSAQSRVGSLTAEIAAAEAAVSEAQLELSWCRVTAPIDGRVSRNMVDVGNIVTADQTVLAEIVNDDFIYAYFNPPERDVIEFRRRRREALQAAGLPLTTQTQTEVPVYLGLATEVGYPHEGVVDYVAPSIDPTTGTIQARARFPNPEALLIPGVFARLSVPFGEPYEALLVTERALGFDQGERYLLVVNDQNVLEQRFVRTGPLRDGLRAIQQGLSPDDRVVVSGLQRLRTGLTVQPNQVPMPTGPLVEPAPDAGEALPAGEAPTADAAPTADEAPEGIESPATQMQPSAGPDGGEPAPAQQPPPETPAANP